MWNNLSSIKDTFGSEYEFTVYITSLAFHPQAFTAQSGASLIETVKGREAMFKYVDACFENQETFMNASIGDAKKSEIDAVFADIAEKAGVLDDTFTKAKFLEDLHDWVLGALLRHLAISTLLHNEVPHNHKCVFGDHVTGAS